MNQSIVLAGGCFWCIEAVFLRVKGVKSVESGYAGGHVRNPSYEQVCSGVTGHAEVVKIEFDGKKLKLSDLLSVFFTVHDPTSLNHQGNDVGEQYRSAIFYTSDSQKKVIDKFLKDAQKSFDKPIVTQVEKLKDFYSAEDYHKEYYDNNQEQGYCQLIISPKIEKFRKKFKELVK